TLELDASISAVARELFKKKEFLYLGRGINYPIALEGALKLKEISYIHAEGYAAGEMKHGPIALIDEDLPVVVLAPRGKLYEKVASNMEEVRSRGGTIIAVTSADNGTSEKPPALGISGNGAIERLAKYSISVKGSNPYLETISLTVPL